MKISRSPFSQRRMVQLHSDYTLHVHYSYLSFLCTLYSSFPLPPPPKPRHQTIKFHLVYGHVCNVSFFSMIFRNNLDILCIRTLHPINLPALKFFISAKKKKKRKPSKLLLKRMLIYKPLRCAYFTSILNSKLLRKKKNKSETTHYSFS